MTRIFNKVLMMVCLIAILALSASGTVHAEEKMVIYVQTGCAHCAKVEEFIEKNGLRDNFEYRDIIADDGADEEFTKFMDDLDVPLEKRGVPVLVYGDDQWVGGDTPIIEYLREKYNIPEESDSGGLVILIVGGVFFAGLAGYGIVSMVNARRTKKKS